jgi:predicted ATPase
MLQGGMGNLNSVFQSAEAVLALSAEHHLGLWFSWATVLRGWALAEHDPEQGIAELQRVDKDMRAKGAIFLQPFVSLLVAESLAKTRQFDRGLDLVNEALPKTESDRYWCDADLHRLRGDLLLAQGVAAVEVEAAFRQGMQIAQKQQAKLFELRAATSLARLWLNQGRSQEAHSLLAPIYEWFTEGLETPDLKNVRALLEISLPRLG